GKKAMSFLFAKAYFCEHLEDIVPCGQWHHCRRIQSGNHPDVHYIYPEGQSIKKEQIQQLIRELSFHGVESKKKVYIIEDADKMSTNAANSLLKFLEEPGEMTHALLLTEQVQQMLPTIISRCQRL